MKSITQLNLKENEKKALQELTEKLSESLPEVEIILYGSKARDDSEAFSDIDVLVLLEREVNNSLEEEIFSIAYELDVVFGILVESKVFWNSDLAHAMPIHWNIDREGIMI